MQNKILVSTFNKIKGLVALSAIFFLVFSQTAFAALLYITPVSASIPLGATFSVTIKVDTQGPSINTVESTVSFSADKLALLSVNQGSTFPMQTPGSLVQTGNTVFFSEGVPSPGYAGGSGVVGRLTFKAIGEGDANISVDSGKVLLNDGFATDALSGMAGSKITVTVASTKVDQPTTQAPVVPVNNIQPIIVTSSDVDQHVWYSNSNVSFGWNKPSGVVGFSYKLDSALNGIPDDVVDTATTSKMFTGLKDGTWYFHIKAFDVNGNSSLVSTYQVLIDTIAPESVTASQTTDAVNTVNFQATDAGSGIDHYVISKDTVVLSNNATSPYVLENIDPGTYNITITAYDKAGNSTVQKIPVVVVKPPTFAQKILQSSWFIYAFVMSIWILLVAIIILLIILIRRHANTANKTRKELMSLKEDVDREINHLKKHIHSELSLLSKKSNLTIPEVKALRKKLTNSIKKVEDILGTSEDDQSINPKSKE